MNANMSNVFGESSDAVENKVPSKASKNQAQDDIKQRAQFQTCKELVDHYSETADRYEKNVQALKYRGPENIGEAVKMLIKDRFDVKILDVGAGTGLVGVELAKQGYTNLDAVDASDVMLKMAADKHAYKQLICFCVGDTPMPFDDDSYDMVVTGGLFAANSLPPTALDDFIRVVRVGGHVINLTRIHEEDWFYKTFEAHMSRLEEQKKWKLLSKTTIPDYLDGHEGYLYIHTIL